MPRRTQNIEEWVGAPRALEILEEVNGRKINSKYLARLGSSGRIRRQAIDGRTYEYNVNDLRATHIAERRYRDKEDTEPRMKAVDKEAA